MMDSHYSDKSPYSLNATNDSRLLWVTVDNDIFSSDKQLHDTESINIL